MVEPGKRPRVTLTPSMALKDGAPWLAFAVQGGDAQEQDSLQFFLNVVEFGMTPQQSVEAATFNTYQLRESFDDRTSSSPAASCSTTPRRRGCATSCAPWATPWNSATAPSGPINAIMLDRKHGTFWGASSNHGEDYGIGW